MLKNGLGSFRCDAITRKAALIMGITLTLMASQSMMF